MVGVLYIYYSCLSNYSCGLAMKCVVLVVTSNLEFYILFCILFSFSGEAEKEYWSLLRGNQDKHKGFKSNRGWWVFILLGFFSLVHWNFPSANYVLKIQFHIVFAFTQHFSLSI